MRRVRAAAVEEEENESGTRTHWGVTTPQQHSEAHRGRDPGGAARGEGAGAASAGGAPSPGGSAHAPTPAGACARAARQAPAAIRTATVAAASRMAAATRAVRGRQGKTEERAAAAAAAAKEAFLSRESAPCRRSLRPFFAALARPRRRAAVTAPRGTCVEASGGRVTLSNAPLARRGLRWSGRLSLTHPTAPPRRGGAPAGQPAGPPAATRGGSRRWARDGAACGCERGAPVRRRACAPGRRGGARDARSRGRAARAEGR